jgi:VCBS repeat-containing protein
MARGSGKVSWVLLLSLVLCLGVGQGLLADAPPPPTRPDGLEVGVDNGVGTGFIHPGETAVTQQVTVTDNDADAEDITLLEVRVFNLGTAVPGDFARIEILDGGGPIGQVLNPVGPWPVAIDINPDFVIPDGGAVPVNQVLQVRCTIDAGATVSGARETIRTRLVIRHAEGAVGWVIPFETVIDDGNATTINNCPAAVADAAVTNEDTPVGPINVLANDNDPDGDPLFVTNLDTTGTVGTVTPVGNAFDYNPNGQFEALPVGGAQIDTFQYTMSDGDAGCGAGARTATVTVTVNGVNDAPVAGNDNAVTDEDTPVVINVLANDNEVDAGDVLTVTGVNTGPPYNTLGVVTVNLDNTITFDPNGLYENLKVSAFPQFEYTVDDGNGGTDTAIVTVEVQGINDPPVANDDADATPEDTAKVIDVLANDVDPDSALNVCAITQGANGTVTNNANNVTYTPDPNWCGVDTFTYRACDELNGDWATVTVTVGCVNDLPVAGDDNAVTDEDNPVVINVLANDTDADTPPALGGDVLTVTGVNTGPPYNTLGVVTVNLDNTITFDPNGLYENLKVSAFPQFEYTVDDGKGGTDTAIVTVEVQGINDPPLALNDVDATPEDTAKVVDVLGNDVDPDSALNVCAITQGANGTVTNNGANVTYTPNPNWCGQDTFTYRACDELNGDWAGVTVNVGCVNDAPVANDDVALVDEDSANNIIDVLGNDTDADTPPLLGGDVLTVDAIVTPPGNGAVTNNGNNVSYTPNPNFVGNDWFEYRVADGKGGTDIARVDVTVRPTAPRFQDDMEGGVNGWVATGQWHLIDDGICCPPPMPSPTHAWIFGNNGFFVGNGTLTSPAIDVTGLAEIDVLFWYCLSIVRGFGVNFFAEISFDGGAWGPIWPDGLPVTLGAWTQVVPPIRVAVPFGAATANLRFNVTSRMGWGCIGVDDVMVAPVGGGGGNRPPTADAGPDQDVCRGDVVNLDGTGSFDPDLDPLGYDWNFLARPVGSAAVLLNANTANPTFVADVAGQFQIELEVDDGRGGTDTDIVVVNANVCDGAPLFFDDVEAGVDGWVAGGLWQIVDNPPPIVPSPIHAWVYGGVLYSGNGTLTSPAINVAGQDAVIVFFDYYLSINPYGWFGTAGTSGRVEISFDGGPWVPLRQWNDASPDQDAWFNTGPLNAVVPPGAATMRLRFNFMSRLGRGGWWIDDITVLGGGGLGPLSVDAGELLFPRSDFVVESVANTPNPVRDVHTTRFSVKGVGIESINVRIFDQAGQLVFDSGWQPNDYDWHLQSDQGETLANGVYLYVVTVLGPNGETFVTETKKLAVYR